MYKNPVAGGYTPGFSFTSFPLSKGTRQRCPLSKLLFNLAMELLSWLLQSTLETSGISIGQNRLKSVFFAEDDILVTTNPNYDIPKLYKLIMQYGSCLGLWIDATKCEVLMLTSRAELKWHHKVCFKMANMVTYFIFYK